MTVSDVSVSVVTYPEIQDKKSQGFTEFQQAEKGEINSTQTGSLTEKAKEPRV